MTETEDCRKAAYDEAKKAFEKLEFSDQMIFLGREGAEVAVNAIGYVARAVADEIDGFIRRAKPNAETDDG